MNEVNPQQGVPKEVVPQKIISGGYPEEYRIVLSGYVQVFGILARYLAAAEQDQARIAQTTHTSYYCYLVVQGSSQRPQTRLVPLTANHGRSPTRRVSCNTLICFPP